ncbi:ethyl tert-butyl ether degradation [Phlyctema vagabunda]|uniref:Ethyl tert-butyl ether degradation n=1 Tax=Phlyctema vagabunda TaxID=108571 RepID=A0ABR4P4K3_9HELO
MPAQLTLLYPAPTDVEFDMEYYLEKHMPVVWKAWAPRGLDSYCVVDVEHDSGYCAECIMTWDCTASFKKAMDIKDEVEILFGDIKNFANVSPVVILGTVVGTN